MKYFFEFAMQHPIITATILYLEFVTIDNILDSIVEKITNSYIQTHKKEDNKNECK